MKPVLRDYQQEIKDRINLAWENNRNVMAVLPTGAGKTVLLSSIVDDNKGATCVIAHRQELVSQISLALARCGVGHNLIATDSVIRTIIKIHLKVLGQSFFNPKSKVAVSGVKTLLNRENQLKSWRETVTLYVTDECHHVIKGNEWGRAIELFPKARGLGVTATPMRADGKGLGSHASGIVDEMIVGVSMRDLIEKGSLTDYKVFAPSSLIDIDSIKKSAKTGDYTSASLSAAVEKAQVHGDVVKHYKKIANGKLGITFATDLKSANQISDSFNNEGIPAQVIHAKTKPLDRVSVLEKFAKKEILQLVNVDIFGEGFDLPAIEVVSMARPTMSYGLYAQQFGRALRPMDGKSHAIIIDHSGNVLAHGLPDSPKLWTLEDRKRKSDSGSQVAIKSCSECTAVYDRFLKACPYCNYVEQIQERKSVEHVTGDLTELDSEVLAAMRGEVIDLDVTAEQESLRLSRQGCPKAGVLANVKRFKERQEDQKAVREKMAMWAGEKRHQGLSDAEIYRSFYIAFGMDWLSAMSLKTKNLVQDLVTKIEKELIY